MNNKLIFSLLGIAALIATVVACSDNPSFGGQDDQNKELILKAKSLVQAQGNAVSLPKVKKSGNDKELSRSNTNAVVEATLLWDEAKTYNKDNETVVLVPMQNDEEISSKVTIKTGENETYQFAKTFSKLVMVFRGEKTISRVFTYLPESDYAYDNKEALNNLGIDLKEAGFHGFVLVTFLNGNRSHVFRYEHGALCSILRKGNAHSHENCKDTACEHKHDENTSKTTVSIKLFTEQSVSRSTAYTSDSERHPCKETGTPSICSCSKACLCSFYCDCVSEMNCLCGLNGDDSYCYTCKKLKDFCTCFPGEEGDKECEICKQFPCVCHSCAACTNAECHCQDGGFCLCK